VPPSSAAHSPKCQPPTAGCGAAGPRRSAWSTGPGERLIAPRYPDRRRASPRRRAADAGGPPRTHLTRAPLSR
jgi:hypothetical protein